MAFVLYNAIAGEAVWAAFIHSFIIGGVCAGAQEGIVKQLKGE